MLPGWGCPNTVSEDVRVDSKFQPFFPYARVGVPSVRDTLIAQQRDSHEQLSSRPVLGRLLNCAVTDIETSYDPVVSVLGWDKSSRSSLESFRKPEAC